MLRMRSKSKNCDWMQNSSLGITPKISRNLAGKYFREQVIGELEKLNFNEKILDIPVSLQQRIIKYLSVKLLLK